MQPTIIGLVVVILGFVALFSRIEMTIKTALLLSVLGAGAAINLPALGGASILAGPLFTGFVFLRMLLTRGGAARFAAAFLPPAPGFFLLIAVAYGIIAAFFIAPFFYGEILVYPISRSTTEGASFSLEPLGWSSGNLTQSVYAIGQLLLYGSMTALVVTPKLHKVALNGLVLLGCVHVAVSILDVLTFYSGTSFLLDWLRTATYAAWTNNAVAGIKRISGLFPESSMYSIYAMTILGVMLRLMLSRYRLGYTRPLTYLTLLFLVMSTSTTAYVSLGLGAVVLLVVGMRDAALLARFGALRVMITCGLTVVAVASLAIIVEPGLAGRFESVVDQTLVNKMETDSGMERGRLNEGAFDTFQDTSMLGVGIGSVRTSSFAMTLLSNLGLIGTLAFLAFVATLFRSDRSIRNCEPETLVLARAARWGVVAALLSASTSYHVFDLGPLFYILAALAHPRLMPARRPVMYARSGPADAAGLPHASAVSPAGAPPLSGW